MAINSNYPVGCGVCVGVFHILFGIASCGSGIAAIVYNAYLDDIGVGIWAGALFILTGVLGLVSGSRNNSVITAYYVMSLLSVFGSMGLMGVFGYSIYIELIECGSTVGNNYNSYLDTDLDYDCPHIIEILALCSTAFLVGFLEWIMAMSSACASCSCCCGSQPQPPAQTVMIHTMQPMPQAPRQNLYTGQPGYNMPPPGPGPFPFEQAAPSYIRKPFSAAPILYPQGYVNPAVDLTPEAGASLPNIANIDGNTKTLLGPY